MDARELRIGNLVEYNGLTMNVWSIGNVSTPKKESYSVDLDSKKHDRHLKGIEIEQINPIPLTEEWADKLGFENLVEMASYFCSESRYPIIITPEDLKAMKVHEAQNLFNDLTGEELSINE